MEDGKDERTDSASDGAFRTQYRGEESVTRAIVKGLAAVEGVHPVALEPLHDSVNTDALEEIFDPPVLFDDRVDVAAEFPTAGYRVTIRRDGSIVIRDATGGE